MTDADRAERTLLVVDDKLDLRVLIRMTFAADNLRLLEAANAREAVEVLRSQRPDVVLLDIMLGGGMDGLEVCRLIRADAALAHTRVVMVTARGQQYERREGLAAGADGYVVKPFSPAQLRAEVLRLLGA